MVEFKIPQHKKIENKVDPRISPIAKAEDNKPTTINSGQNIGIIGLPAMPHIQGTNKNDRMNVMSEINKSAMPNATKATIDGGKGNDTFVFNLSQMKKGATYYIEDTQGKNEVLFKGPDVHIMIFPYKPMEVPGAPKVTAVPNNGSLYMVEYNGARLFMDAKHISKVSLEMNMGKQDLLTSNGKEFTLNNYTTDLAARFPKASKGLEVKNQMGILAKS